MLSTPEGPIFSQPYHSRGAPIQTQARRQDRITFGRDYAQLVVVAKKEHGTRYGERLVFRLWRDGDGPQPDSNENAHELQ